MNLLYYTITSDRDNSLVKFTKRNRVSLYSLASHVTRVPGPPAARGPFSSSCSVEKDVAKYHGNYLIHQLWYKQQSNSPAAAGKNKQRNAGRSRNPSSSWCSQRNAQCLAFAPRHFTFRGVFFVKREEYFAKDCSYISQNFLYVAQNVRGFLWCRTFVAFYGVEHSWLSMVQNIRAFLWYMMFVTPRGTGLW